MPAASAAMRATMTANPTTSPTTEIRRTLIRLRRGYTRRAARPRRGADNDLAGPPAHRLQASASTRQPARRRGDAATFAALGDKLEVHEDVALRLSADLRFLRLE